MAEGRSPGSARPEGRLSRIVASALLGAITVYRLVIAPWLPRRCRFEPSCSAYALDAIARHGPWTGTVLALGRVSRCHPWHPGGHDPVPPAADDVVQPTPSDRGARRCA